MKRFRAFASFAIFCLLFMIEGTCTAKMSASITYRLRFELWNGFNKKAYGDYPIDAKGQRRGDPDDRIILQRVIGGLEGESHSFSWRLLLYDARVWGWSLDQNDFVKNKGTHSEYVMDPYEEYLEPYEAYFSLKLPVGEGSRFILGRQIIWYGDKRIFGPGSWGNAIGWLWDAARLSIKFHNKGFVDTWYGQTKTKDPESLSLFSKHAYQGVGLYGHFPILNQLSLEPFFAWKNALYYTNGKKEDTFFFGSRFVREKENGFVFDITLAKELGQYLVRRARDRDVDAWAYILKAGYRFGTIPLSPLVMFGRIYASGDPHPERGKVRRFMRPFGSTDGQHYGRMDLMFWGNMVDNQVDIRLFPMEDVKIRLAFHDFNLEEPNDSWTYFGYRVRGNKYDHIGNELDFVLRLKVKRYFRVQTFYSHFWAGDFVTKNHIARNDADRFVFQITFDFGKVLSL